MTFKITRKHAEDLIDAYINEVIKKSNVPNIIGGTIKVDGILSMRSFWNSMRNGFKSMNFPVELEILRGLTAWSCWKNAEKKEDMEFFLVFEIHNGLILKPDDIQFPWYEELVHPIEILAYKDPLTAHDLLDAVSLNVTKPDKITRGFNLSNPESGSALYSIHEFKNHGPKDLTGKFFNEFSFGLFENRLILNEVDDFIDQHQHFNMKYIRYYFGYDPAKDGNKIRVILIGVDENGKNILPATKEKLVETEPFLIQNSWPPKP